MPIVAPRYTVDDLDNFPADGQHYELLDGILLVTPAPARQHQVVVARLNALLLAALPPGGSVEVVSPGRIQAGRTLRLEPDILVYPAPRRRDAQWTDITSWLLAVEVLSPSTRIYDSDWKRQAYQALRVGQVWLVDPDARRISSWIGPDPVPRVFTGRMTWHPEHHHGIKVELDIASLFE